MVFDNTVDFSDLEPEFSVPESALKKAREIKLLILDVDGVMTSGALFFDNHGQEYKAFNSLDGHGLKMLQHSGVEVAIITGRKSTLVEHRMQDLGITHLHQGHADKLPVFKAIQQDLSLEKGQIAYAGDDVVDLPAMLSAGFSISVANGHHLARKYADWVTPSTGGQGAVRDICELLMYAQGNYSDMMSVYFGVERQITDK